MLQTVRFLLAIAEFQPRARCGMTVRRSPAPPTGRVGYARIPSAEARPGCFCELPQEMCIACDVRRR